MQDKYPTDFSLEIERPALTRYYRASRRKELATALLWPFLVGGFVLVLGLGKTLPLGAALFLGAGSCLLLWQAVVALSHLLFIHRQALEEANALHVSVEGPFLRIREGGKSSSDRRLHFRSIVDYATLSDQTLRRHGIACLRLTTMGGCFDSEIEIAGIRDCLDVRDMLSEIDASREGDLSSSSRA